MVSELFGWGLICRGLEIQEGGLGRRDKLTVGVTGAAGGMMAGLTGDREKQQEYQMMHDDGKTAQRSVEADIQKQA